MRQDKVGSHEEPSSCISTTCFILENFICKTFSGTLQGVLNPPKHDLSLGYILIYNIMIFNLGTLVLTYSIFNYTELYGGIVLGFTSP